MMDAGWDYDDLYNPLHYIQSVRNGVKGSKAKDLVNCLGVPRTVLAKIMKVDESNLARLFRRDTLPGDQSETLMDTARLFLKAIRVFDDQGMAQEWMQTRNAVLNGQAPNELLDTFEGRRWIDQVLTNIEFGEFT